MARQYEVHPANPSRNERLRPGKEFTHFVIIDYVTMVQVIETKKITTAAMLLSPGTCYGRGNSYSEAKMSAVTWARHFREVLGYDQL